jgi:histidinol phosphatase-like PHP family hydrolase
VIDLHTHTIFSDGELIPSELLQRTKAMGYSAVAITDHADPTNIEYLIKSIQKIKTFQDSYDLQILVGVELTHVLPSQISQLAAKARKMGAEIIVVHGETIVEPVAAGTNHEALKSDIDILAHPGFITPEDVKLAADNDIYLELTSRCGHNYTNGYVARIATDYGAKLVVNSDTHAPCDLMTHKKALDIAVGAGLTRSKAEQVMKNSKELVDRITIVSTI